MPYLVRLLIARRLAEWQNRLSRLGAYLAGTPPTEPPAQRKTPPRKG